jgi:hypothetical protein
MQYVPPFAFRCYRTAEFFLAGDGFGLRSLSEKITGAKVPL